MPPTSDLPLFQRCCAALVEHSRGAGLLLAALWLMLFNQLQVEWSINPQYSYGWLMPLLGFYLLYRRWEDRPKPESPNLSLYSTILQVSLAAGLAFLLLPGRLVQEANPDWRLVSWWLAFCVLGLTLLALYRAGGSSWLRHFSFPFVFMLLAVPWPTVPEQAVIQNMMQSVTTVTVEALNWCGIFALQRGNLIELPGGVVGIDEACSGVRSFQSTLMAALFIGELSRLSWAKRLFLLVSGLVLAFLLNCLRAFSLAFFFTRSGSKSLEEWHDPAGYAILLISFGLLLLIAYKIAGPAPHPKSASPTNPPTEARFSGKWLAAMGLWLLFCEVGTRLWYLSHEQHQTSGRNWTLSWPQESETFQKREISEKVQTILRYNEGTQGLFRNPDGTVWNFFELVWYPGRISAQLTRSHSPEICLPAIGAAPVGEKSRESWTINSIPFTLDAYTFRQGPNDWYVFYVAWENSSSPRNDASTDNFYAYSAKFKAVWRGERNLGQKVLQLAASGYPDRQSAQFALKEYLTKSVIPE